MANKVRTQIVDENGGFVKWVDGLCTFSPDGSIWRQDVDDNGNPTWVKVE
jgi:hypothetical protein